MGTQPNPTEKEAHASGGETADPALDLREAITGATANRPGSISAHTFIRKWDSDSKPAALLCDGGEAYVVKALQATKPVMARVLVNDQIVARLAELIDAPVPRAALVDVPAELISNQVEMAHMTAGVGHGSQFIKDVTERANFDHVNIPENRSRFALLATLFGWIGAQDHQFVYRKATPYLVYSVDHGHFFPGGPSWTQDSLRQAPRAQVDTHVATNCNLTNDEVNAAVQQLSIIEDETLARIVAIPPDGWSFSMDERVVMLEFLIRRRDELLSLLPPAPVGDGEK